MNKLKTLLGISSTRTLFTNTDLSDDISPSKAELILYSQYRPAGIPRVFFFRVIVGCIATGVAIIFENVWVDMTFTLLWIFFVLQTINESNRYVLKIALCFTFEVYYKVLNMGVGILGLLIICDWNKTARYNNLENTMLYPYGIIIIIGDMSIAALISLSDGFSISPKFKLSLAFLWSIYFTWRLISAFLQESNAQLHITPYFSTSWRSITISSLITTIIFVIKQVGYVILFPNRLALINMHLTINKQRKYDYLKFNNNSNNSNNNKQNKKKNENPDSKQDPMALANEIVNNYTQNYKNSELETETNTIEISRLVSEIESESRYSRISRISQISQEPPAAIATSNKFNSNYLTGFVEPPPRAKALNIPPPLAPSMKTTAATGTTTTTVTKVVTTKAVSRSKTPTISHSQKMDIVISHPLPQLQETDDDGDDHDSFSSFEKQSELRSPLMGDFIDNEEENEIETNDNGDNNYNNYNDYNDDDIMNRSGLGSLPSLRGLYGQPPPLKRMSSVRSELNKQMERYTITVFEDVTIWFVLLNKLCLYLCYNNSIGSHSQSYSQENRSIDRIQKVLKYSKIIGSKIVVYGCIFIFALHICWEGFTFSQSARNIAKTFNTEFLEIYHWIAVFEEIIWLLSLLILGLNMNFELFSFEMKHNFSVYWRLLSLWVAFSAILVIDYNYSINHFSKYLPYEICIFNIVIEYITIIISVISVSSVKAFLLSKCVQCLMVSMILIRWLHIAFVYTLSSKDVWVNILGTTLNMRGIIFAKILDAAIWFLYQFVEQLSYHNKLKVTNVKTLWVYKPAAATE